MVGLTVFVGMHDKRSVGDWPLALVFLALFLLADLSGLRFEVRRQAFTLTLVEIPTLLGLFFLPPVTFITVRLLVAAIIQFKRRLVPVKAAFNVVILGTGAAVSCLVISAYGPVAA